MVSQSQGPAIDSIEIDWLACHVRQMRNPGGIGSQRPFMGRDRDILKSLTSAFVPPFKAKDGGSSPSAAHHGFNRPVARSVVDAPPEERCGRRGSIPDAGSAEPLRRGSINDTDPQNLYLEWG